MLPLGGFRVIAVERYGAGPFGSPGLADLGADVIKTENPPIENPSIKNPSIENLPGGVIRSRLAGDPSSPPGRLRPESLRPGAVKRPRRRSIRPSRRERRGR